MGTGIWETASSAPRSGSSRLSELEVCGAAAPHGYRSSGAGPRAAASAHWKPRPFWNHSNGSRVLIPAVEPLFSRKDAGPSEDSIDASGATHGA